MRLVVVVGYGFDSQPGHKTVELVHGASLLGLNIHGWTFFFGVGVSYRLQGTAGHSGDDRSNPKDKNHILLDVTFSGTLYW